MRFQYILSIPETCEAFLNKCYNYKDILSIYKVFKNKNINDNIVYHILKNKKYDEEDNLIELFNELTFSMSDIDKLFDIYKYNKNVILFIINKFLVPNDIINKHIDTICYILSTYNIKSTIFKYIYKKYKNTLLCDNLTNSIIRYNINTNKILPFVKLNKEQVNLIFNNGIYRNILIKMLYYNDIPFNIINKNKYNILDALVLNKKQILSHHKIKKILLNIILFDKFFTEAIIVNIKLNDYYISNILNIYKYNKNILSLLLKNQNIPNHLIDIHYDSIFELLNNNNISDYDIKLYFKSIRKHLIFKDIINKYINTNDIIKLSHIIDIVELPCSFISKIFDKYKKNDLIMFYLLMYQNINQKILNQYILYICELFSDNIDNVIIINLLYNKYKNNKIMNEILKYIIAHNKIIKLYTFLLITELKSNHYIFVLKHI